MSVLFIRGRTSVQLWRCRSITLKAEALFRLTGYFLTQSRFGKIKIKSTPDKRWPVGFYIYSASCCRIPWLSVQPCGVSRPFSSASATKGWADGASALLPANIYPLFPDMHFIMCFRRASRCCWCASNVFVCACTAAALLLSLFIYWLVEKLLTIFLAG